jgi:hypothetical protein
MEREDEKVHYRNKVIKAQQSFNKTEEELLKGTTKVGFYSQTELDPYRGGTYSMELSHFRKRTYTKEVSA